MGPPRLRPTSPRPARPQRPCRAPLLGRRAGVSADPQSGPASRAVAASSADPRTGTAARGVAASSADPRAGTAGEERRGPMGAGWAWRGPWDGREGRASAPRRGPWMSQRTATEPATGEPLPTSLPCLRSGMSVGAYRMVGRARRRRVRPANDARRPSSPTAREAHSAVCNAPTRGRCGPRRPSRLQRMDAVRGGPPREVQDTRSASARISARIAWRSSARRASRRLRVRKRSSPRAAAATEAKRSQKCKAA